ncbi:hypothetical protein BDZ90DRAFT_234362 [Jaminaea rosea]|uniref:Uncharacterized protein n=1 Tax=Jaminaea rosea TaxID=1569628 RepID=A0A316UMK4_9BASI|nr:hypothetical protein BDZ90DRAFT_234362 [Jaminaea rosea]PWN25153.1 hypothetical protein BDZ90DRAFT_234362 [Jaminaea rosea]
MASFSSYLSFSAMYEFEQYQKDLAKRAQASKSGGVLRRDSNSSTTSSNYSASSASSSSTSSSSRRVHFLNHSDSDSDLASSPSSSSVYASHAARLHSSGKRYSTADGSLRGSQCPWDLCTHNATCRRCISKQIEEQDLSLQRFGR